MAALRSTPATSTSRSCRRHTVLQVYLRDQSDQAVKTEGYKGVAIFVIDGKPQRIPLMPAGENRLSGTSSRRAPGRAEGRRADHDPDREHDAGQVRLTNIHHLAIEPLGTGEQLTAHGTQPGALVIDALGRAFSSIAASSATIQVKRDVAWHRISISASPTV